MLLVRRELHLAHHTIELGENWDLDMYEIDWISFATAPAGDAVHLCGSKVAQTSNRHLVVHSDCIG